MAKKDMINPETAEVVEVKEDTMQFKPVLANIRISDLSERFCFNAETLGDLRAQRDRALAGERIPSDEWKDLTARISALTQRDERLHKFWTGPQAKEAAALLKTLIIVGLPEQEPFTVHAASGDVSALTYYSFDPNQKMKIAVDGDDYRSLHALGAALAVVGSQRVKITSYGRALDMGTVFAREGKNAIYVARHRDTADKVEFSPGDFVVFTVVMRGGVPQFLPFTDRFDGAAMKWKYAACIAQGIVPVVSCEDDTALRELHVNEGFVRERFAQLYGAENWPYERQEWREARYPKVEDIFTFEKGVVEEVVNPFAF
jgi:hypothetical protein